MSPSAWMPAVCVNTSRPTTGVFAATSLPENVATSAEIDESRDSTTPVRYSVWSWSVATISASRVLPVRSPIPFTLVCTPRAPARTAARQFALARP